MLDARLLTAFGFGLFAIGLGLSSLQTPQTDFEAMFWPQIIRGVAIMFCLLPPTRLALGHLDSGRVPDASGLFNLMRNLGGAIGLAMIDTVIYTRAPVHITALAAKLQAGDIAAARFVGAPLDALAAAKAGVLDPGALAALQPLVEKTALAQAINEAWAMVALLTVAALICVPFAKVHKPQ
jgi:MFS transporter, DHA2 family, multidrug resistance protein